MPENLARSPRELRDEVEQLVRDDLVGPLGGEREELGTETRPIDRYLLGLLAPRMEPRPGAGTALAAATSAPADRENPEEDENAAADVQPEDELASGGVTADSGAEGRPEERPAAIDQLVPSAFGLTVAVDEGCDTLRVSASWGAYDKATSETRLARDGGAARVWRRRPCGGEVIVLIGQDGRIAPQPLDADEPDVRLEGLVRKRDGGDLVSLFLVNGQEVGGRSVEKWLCQAELRVEATDGSAVFVRRSVDAAALTPAVDRQELRGLELLYRDTVELAVGHGVATEVELAPNRPDRGFRVKTTALPAADVPRTDAPGLADFADPAIAAPFAVVGDALDMARLGAADDVELPVLLHPLVDAYVAWLDGQERRIGDPAARLEGHEEIARDHLRERR
jgi:hypothetical protein